MNEEMVDDGIYPHGINEMYPDDVTDEEWELIRPILEGKRANKKSKYSARIMINAIFYFVHSGCPWRSLPEEFPPWQLVYVQFKKWRAQKVFGKLDVHLRKNLRILSKRARAMRLEVINLQFFKNEEAS